MDDERRNEGLDEGPGYFAEETAGADGPGPDVGGPAGSEGLEPLAGEPAGADGQWQYAGGPAGADGQWQYAGGHAGADGQWQYAGGHAGAGTQGQYAGGHVGYGAQAQAPAAVADTDSPAQKKRRKASLPGWGIVVITVACTILVGFAIIAGILLQVATLGSDVASKAYSGPSAPYVAKVTVAGEIGNASNRYYSSDTAYHHAWTLETVDTLIEDENNKGIYLWINTPGGGVYESDELYLKLMEYKEKTGRPIYVYMEKMATSGGYYVAAASDEIYANRNTWTGSIGVTMGTFFDVSEFLETHGIHTETVTAGDNKAMGGYFDPLTAEQIEIFQGLVDDAYDRFVAIVAEGRGLPEADVRKLADGRIYTAGQALESGLIDFILGEKDAEDAIKGKFDDDTIISDCIYMADTNYLTQIGLLTNGRIGLWDIFRGGAGSGAAGAGAYGSDGPGSGAYGSDGPDAGAYGSGDPGTVYEGDIAAVLDLAREQAEAGLPPLKYMYGG